MAKQTSCHPAPDSGHPLPAGHNRGAEEKPHVSAQRNKTRGDNAMGVWEAGNCIQVGYDGEKIKD